jgi:hypothetical protein
MLMDAEERKHLLLLRETHIKRFRVLELKAAIYGIDTPPHILMEIEDLKEKIRSIDLQLGEGQILVSLVDHMKQNLARQGFARKEEIFKGVDFNYIAELEGGFFVFSEKYHFLFADLNYIDRQSFNIFRETCIKYAQAKQGFFQPVKYFVFIAVSRKVDLLAEEHIRNPATSIIKLNWSLGVFLVYGRENKEIYHANLKAIPHWPLRELISENILL